MRVCIIALILIFIATVDCQATNDSTIHVYLIPHTHDDVGWLKTISEYFYGFSKSGNDILGIQYIIEGIIGELASDPEKRFSWVEIGYFYRYWINQDEMVRDTVRKLVREGRLEFINGGWAMHDEAVTYYEDMIDNMALGQKFIKDNFGVCPTIGWQIDPFGHSSTNAALFSKMGLDAFWFARIDHTDKEKRKKEKNLEFIWEPRTSQGDENQILGIVNFDHYDFPRGLGFDYNNKNSQFPIIDDPSIPGYNLDFYTQIFIDYVKSASDSYYNHNHMAVMMGGDFAYQIAAMPFINYDKIKDHINNNFDRFNMKITYSVPSEYVQAIYAENLNFTINNADFFPYSDEPNAYWTGYYSSRNYLKGLVRKAGRELQNVRRFFTYSLWRGDNFFDQSEIDGILAAFFFMERKLAELQHHDGVTGTSQQHVVDDYTRHLSLGRDILHQNVTKLLFNNDFQKLLGYSNNNIDFSICNEDEVRSPKCNTFGLKQKKTVVLAVFNPVEAKSKIVSFPVPHGNFIVTSLSGRKISAEVICFEYMSIGCTAYFRDDFASQATQYYLLTPASNSLVLSDAVLFQNDPTTETIQISDSQVLKVARSLVDYKSIIDGEETNWSLRYKAYTPNKRRGQSSGVYIFCPVEQSQDNVPAYAQPTVYRVLLGNIVKQIVITWGDKLFTRMTIFDDLSNIQIESLITEAVYNNPAEIIMVIYTDIQNGGTFYTDSNGMEMQQRKLNYRETWNWTSDESIASNYYPITSSIYIEDTATQKRATLLVDRSVGGSSLDVGKLEIMLDRRLLKDDDRGIGEFLNETHRLQWHTTTLLVTSLSVPKGHYYRSVQYDLDQPNLVFSALIPADSQFYLTASSYSTNSTALLALPPNVKVLPWPISQNQFIVRFHNMDDQNVATINLATYLNSQAINLQLTETTVTGNQELASMLKRKIDWTHTMSDADRIPNQDYLQSQSITLRGQEIRTFLMTSETVLAVQDGSQSNDNASAIQKRTKGMVKQQILKL